MFHIFWMIKTILITVFVVAILQIEVGSKSLETRAMNFIRHAPIMSPVQDLAKRGGSYIGKKWDRFSKAISSSFTGSQDPTQPGSRLQLDLNRSQEYLKAKAKKAQEKAEQKIKDWESQSITSDSQNP